MYFSFVSLCTAPYQWEHPMHCCYCPVPVSKGQLGTANLSFLHQEDLMSIYVEDDHQKKRGDHSEIPQDELEQDAISCAMSS
jgi:hypothetical protein